MARSAGVVSCTAPARLMRGLGRRGMGTGGLRTHAATPCSAWARRRNIRSMSVDTVIALPDDLKAALDRRAPSPPERDELIAAALRAYFAWPRPDEDASDLAVINDHADELNAEAEDALSYQVPL